jgi:hypothetical protein
LDDG